MFFLHADLPAWFSTDTSQTQTPVKHHHGNIRLLAPLIVLVLASPLGAAVTRYAAKSGNNGTPCRNLWHTAAQCGSGDQVHAKAETDKSSSLDRGIGSDRVNWSPGEPGGMTGFPPLPDSTNPVSQKSTGTSRTAFPEELFRVIF